MAPCQSRALARGPRSRRAPRGESARRSITGRRAPRGRAAAARRVHNGHEHVISAHQERADPNTIGQQETRLLQGGHGEPEVPVARPGPCESPPRCVWQCCSRADSRVAGIKTHPARRSKAWVVWKPSRRIGPPLGHSKSSRVPLPSSESSPWRTARLPAPPRGCVFFIPCTGWISPYGSSLPQASCTRNKEDRSEEHTSELQSRLHIVC